MTITTRKTHPACLRPCLNDWTKTKINTTFCQLRLPNLKDFSSDIFNVIILSFFLSLLLLSLRYQVAVGHGESMDPTLSAWNIQILDKMANPDYGDIVSFEVKSTDTRFDEARKLVPGALVGDSAMTKRVIALPGDSLLILGNNIFVNNHLIDTSVWFKTDDWNSEHKLDTNIENLSGYFVLGDNRTDSYDSIYMGPIYSDNIVGVWVNGSNNENLAKLLYHIIH